MRIGILSDTHGVIHPAVFPRMSGVDLILHAGDVGDPDVLERLEALAPVTAVRGNVDDWPGAERLPEAVDVTVGGLAVHMTHIGHPESAWAESLDGRRGLARPRLVVCGHTHAPRKIEVGSYLFLNPGSAGRKRFGLPLTLALLSIGEGDAALDVRIVQLEPGRES